MGARFDVGDGGQSSRVRRHAVFDLMVMTVLTGQPSPLLRLDLLSLPLDDLAPPLSARQPAAMGSVASSVNGT
jgi:hypothetical protein